MTRKISLSLKKILENFRLKLIGGVTIPSNCPMKPVVVDDVLLAFPAGIKHLMPPYDEIPQEFKRIVGSNPWCAITNRWFGEGLPKGTGFFVKDGIDARTAIRHIRTILGSFEPKHEHKIATVAYLMSLWFDKIEIPESGPSRRHPI